MSVSLIPNSGHGLTFCNWDLLHVLHSCCRWDRVADKVPGKTKVECFKRFKELRELFGKKK